MNKGAVLVVLGVFRLCLPLAAQQTSDETITLAQLRNTSALDAAAALTFDQSNVFSIVDSSMLIRGLPMPTLWDGLRFPVSSELARMGTMPRDLFPVALLRVVETPTVTASKARPTDLPEDLEELRLERSLYATGEMGFSYGTTLGKFGYETKQGYIVGTVGNDKYQITAGASYQESSFRIPRQGR